MRKLLEKKIVMEEETMEPSTSNPQKYSSLQNTCSYKYSEFCNYLTRKYLTKTFRDNLTILDFVCFARDSFFFLFT